MPTLGPPTTSTLISLSKDFLRRMPLIGDEFILVNYPPPTNKKILNHFGLGKKNSNKRGACQTGEDRLTTGRAPAVKKTRTVAGGGNKTGGGGGGGVTRILKTGRRELNPKK